MEMLVTASVISFVSLTLTIIVAERVKVRPLGEVHIPVVSRTLDPLAAQDVALLYNGVGHQRSSFASGVTSLAPAAARLPV
jgi:hypothetical protein